MPTPRTWLPRVYEIIETLKASSADRFDRPAIEKLFELQRRAAHALMKQAGAVHSGSHFVVPRQVLLAWVEKVEDNEAQELVRRRELSEQIDHSVAEHRAVQQALAAAGKQSQQFPLTREILEATLDSLPPDVHITPGRITINYDPTDAMQACQLLYALGLVIANDYDSFATVAQSGRPSGQTVKPTGGLTAVQPFVQPLV